MGNLVSSAGHLRRQAGNLLNDDNGCCCGTECDCPFTMLLDLSGMSKCSGCLVICDRGPLQALEWTDYSLMQSICLVSDFPCTWSGTTEVDTIVNGFSDQDCSTPADPIYTSPGFLSAYVVFDPSAMTMTISVYLNSISTNCMLGIGILIFFHVQPVANCFAAVYGITNDMTTCILPGDPINTVPISIATGGIVDLTPGGC